MFTGSLGGVRNTLSRTFATRKSSLSETYNTTLPNDDDDVEDPSATTTTTTSDNKKEGKKGNEPEFKFDMEDEEDIDMDSIPFIWSIIFAYIYNFCNRLFFFFVYNNHGSSSL